VSKSFIVFTNVRKPKVQLCLRTCQNLKSKLGLAPVTAIGNSGLDFAIKWIFLGSAAGDAAPLVFIIAVPELPPGKWQVYEIRGLSATTDSGKIGYLVIGHDRHGTSDFFQWFLKKNFITTKTRTDNDLKDENGMWSETSVS